jgi:O-antigen ligase
MTRARIRHSSQSAGDWPAYLIAVLLAAAILFGGGGAEGQVNNGVILCASTFFFAGLAVAHWQGARRLPAQAWIPVWLVAGFLVVGALQLIPVPPSMWRGLPGRDLAQSALALVPGGGDGWRPLSLDPEATRRSLAALLLPSTIMLATLGATRGEVLLFLRAIVACALISCIIGALQLGLGDPGLLSFYDGPNSGAASGLFANPNHQAAMLLAAIVCVGLIIRLDEPAEDPRPRRGRFQLDPTWLLLPFFVVMNLAAGSRVGSLLLLAAVPASLIVSLGRRSPRIWVGAILGVVLIVAIVSIFSPSGNQMAATQSFLFSNDKRFAILPDVLFTLRSYWPWGSGLGTFVPVFAVNENLDLASRAFVNHAHDDLLELLTETGVAGAIWLALAAAATVYRMVTVARSADRSGGRAALAWGGLFILAIFALHSLVDYPLRTLAISAIAGLAVGLMFGDFRRGRDEPRRQRARRWPYAAAALAAAAIGAQVMTIYVAQAAVRKGNGTTGASLRPQNGPGLALAAEEQLKAHQNAEARNLATEAIRRAPLSAVALRVLATLDDLEHRGGMAAWRVASATGWRDTATQYWAMQQALLNKEYDTAAIRADALLRTSNEDNRERLGTIRAVSANAPFRKALIGRMLLDPPWRSAYFAVPANASDQQVAGVYSTLAELLAMHRPVAGPDSRSVMAALIARKHYDQAIAVHRAISPASGAAGPIAGLDFNNSAEYYIDQATPFDWNVSSSGGSIASVEQSGNQRVLVLETDGRELYQPVRKYLALEPGRYRLGYAMRGAIDTPETFGIGIRCADSVQPLAGSSAADLPGSGPVERAMDFVVPAGCPLQLLAFEAKATGEVAEAQFTGLWLRRM